MSTYTPTAANVPPAYGQQSAAVLNLQRSLNQKNAGATGYTPLAEDGKFGPLTQAATKFSVPSLITTSGSARSTYNKNSASLDTALKMFNIGSTPAPQSGDTTTTDTTSNDPYMTSLDSLAKGSDDASKMLIANIQAAKQRQQNSIDTQYSNYKSGLQLLGIQHNDAQSTPELLTGHIQQAENEHQDKISQLNADESKAILDANNARADQDFKVLQEKTDYLKQIKTDKADELKNYYDTISQQTKVAPDIAHEVYSTLQGLDDADKQEFIQQVAKQFNLPLGSLVTALNDEKLNIQTNDIKTQNAQATLNKKLAPKTTTGTGSISKSQISAGAQALENNKGADGYVDPYFYADAYKDWVSKGGTQKSFITNFPPKLFVNPAATNLPPYLMPPKAAGSGRSSA